MAAQAAPAVANMFVGARGREKRANEQVATQGKLNEQAAETNYRYSQMGAEEAYKRDVRLYNELYSPRSLLAQGRDAGVNPVTMLGGGGGFKPVVNSTSTPTSGGAQAGQAATASQMMSERTVAAQAGSQAIQQAAMVAADVDLKRAQAENLRAEIPEIGARTGLLQSQTDLANAQTGLAALDSHLKRYDMDISRMNAELAIELKEINRGTIYEKYKNIMREGEYIDEEIERAKRENAIGAATAEDAMKAVGMKNLEMMSTIIEKEARAKLDDSHRAEIEKQIQNWGYQLPPWTQFWNFISNTAESIAGGKGNAEYK